MDSSGITSWWLKRLPFGGDQSFPSFDGFNIKYSTPWSDCRNIAKPASRFFAIALAHKCNKTNSKTTLYVVLFIVTQWALNEVSNQTIESQRLEWTIRINISIPMETCRTCRWRYTFTRDVTENPNSKCAAAVNVYVNRFIDKSEKDICQLHV